MKLTQVVRKARGHKGGASVDDNVMVVAEMEGSESLGGLGGWGV